MAQSPQSQVRCVVCNELLSFNGENTWELVHHLNDRHPNLKVTRFDVSLDGPNWIVVGGRKLPEDVQSVKSADLYPSQEGKKKKELPPCAAGKPPSYEQRRYLYLCSVARWRPDRKAKIHCPGCCNYSVPIQRLQRVPPALTTCGALCACACWPFCLIPGTTFYQEVVHLYCPRCGHYLGTYNLKKSVMVRMAPTKSYQRYSQSVCVISPCVCD